MTERTTLTTPGAIRRRLLAGATSALLAGVAGLPLGALAQETYPTKPVTIVIGFPPGTATDVLARLLAERMSQHLGQPFVVDNRPGMGGGMGASVVARAKPDGYTLLIGATAPISINPHVYGKTSYDPTTDFAAVGPLAWVPMMLVAAPAVPADNLQQLLALAREKPGTVTFASTGNGTTSHLVMEMISAGSKTEFSHIPYKGSAQAQADIMGGQVAVSFDTLGSSLALVRAGKLKALAVSTAKRTAAVPDVPTTAEQGFPGFEVVAWTGMLAPAGTPAPVLDRLAKALVDVTGEAEFRAKVTQGGNEVRAPMSRAAFTAFMKKDYEDWGKVVRQFNVKPN